MSARLSRSILILAVAVALCAGSAGSQTISGIIAGRIIDPQQKPLASVAVTAHNPDTGRDFPTSSDDQGYYRILEVPPGLYEVTAVLGGFQTENHTRVRVDVNRTTVEDFSLKIQTAVESVTVQSTAPMAILDSPTLSSASDKKPITELPIITRDVNNLALLAPGVESVRTFSFASTLVPFSVNGSRGRDNNFIIDSVDNNEPLFGGAATQFTNAETFQEYSILTGQLKAEFGRNSGATVNAITKSGSNNWHGTFFSYGQSNDFDALNRVEKEALLTSPEPFDDTTVGATLGGPIKKDKSFFFLSYQWEHLSDNLTDVFPVLANYPANPAALAAIEALPTNPGLQAYLATPSVNKVPLLTGTNCFATPPQNNSLGLYQMPNPCLTTPTAVPIGGVFTPAAMADFNVWNVPNANTFNLRDHQLSGRFDQRLNNSNDFYARYLFDDLASPVSPLESSGVGAFSDIGLLPDWKQFLRTRTQSILADHRYQRVGSLNEFRFSYSRVAQGQGPFDAPADTLNRPSAIISDCFASNGLTPPIGTCPTGTTNTIGQLGGAGTVGFAEVAPIGIFPSAGSLITLGSSSSPTHNISNTYQIQDNYSYTHGKHNFKFGVNFVKIDTNTLGVPDDNGFYLFNGFNVPPFINGFQSFLTEGDLSPACTPYENCLSNANIVSQRLVNVHTNAQGTITGFAGCTPGCSTPDELKIKEFDQFYFAQDDWRARPNLTISLGIRYENFGQPINSVHDINSAAPFVNTDNKDFAPRLGVAWSPSQHWVLRAGYGIQYNPPILALPLLIWQSGPVSPLITADTFGLSTLSPSALYPDKPFSLLSNLTQTYPAGTPFLGGTTTTAVSADMVQGCSQYFDLFNTLNGTPVQPGIAYNEFALNSAGVTAPSTVPLVNCSAQNTVSRNLKNPYVQLWSLGSQWELGSNYLFELDYVGSKGTRLFQRVEENPFQGWNSTCLSDLASVYSAADVQNLEVYGQCRWNRINNTHGDITEVTNGGSSSYNALQATLTKRFARDKHFGDFSLTTAYTWSHLIDNTSEIFGPGFRTFHPGDFQASTSPYPLTLLFDPVASSPVESITPLAQTYNETTNAERASSSFDRRHRLASSFLWEPFPTRNALLRGWQLNGIITYQSGQPYSPLNAYPLSPCADSNGNGTLSNARPDIGNPNLPIGTVALIDIGKDPLCLPTAAGGNVLYNVYKNGLLVTGGADVTAAMAATMAHFVQRPLFATATIPGFTLTSNPNSFAQGLGQEYSGTAGRNSLVGPALANFDFSIYRTISLSERFKLQLRAEAYDLLNHPGLGNGNGNPYVGNATGAPAFAYAATRTGAAITGGIPENAIDAIDQVCAPPSPSAPVCAATGRKSNYTFLSTSTMNTGSRRLQFGLRLIF